MYIKNPLIIKNAQLLSHMPCGNEFLQNKWNYLQNLMSIDPVSLSETDRINLLEERILNGDFKLYVQIVSEGKFKFDLVHDVIASFFLDLLFLKNSKSMLSLGPRHGKSALMTWLLTYTFALNNGQQNGLYATYGKSLTVLFGRDIRDTFLNPVFLKLFPESKLSQTSRGAMDFATNNGGKFAGVSVGASCTGKGAGIMSEHAFPGGLIVDDGVKDMKSALSETSMASLAQWYSSEMSTRGNKYHFKLITATRYSLNDLHANLLGEYDEYTNTYQNQYTESNPDGWRYLNIPARCGNEETDPLNRKLGEAAWPAVFNEEYLINAEKEKGAFTFAALYMGNPQPKDGGVFKEKWLSWCDSKEVPRLSHVYVALDPSFGVLRDESVFTVCGVSAKTDELYILEQSGDSSWEFPELIKESNRLSRQYNPLFFLVESTASGKPLMQHFKRQSKTNINPIIMKAYPEKGTPLKNKQQKVSQVLPVFIDDKVICVRNESWNYKLFQQVRQFPFGAHDDRLDSLCIGVEYWILNLRKKSSKSETIINNGTDANNPKKPASIIELINESKSVSTYSNALQYNDTTPTFNW